MKDMDMCIMVVKKNNSSNLNSSNLNSSSSNSSRVFYFNKKMK